MYKRALDDHCIVTLSDERARILSVNDKFLETSRFEPEQVIGRTIFQLYPDTQLQDRASAIHAVLHRGESWSGETEWKRSDGSSYWTHSTIVPFFNKKGAFTHSIAVGTDITESKIAQAESQLREALDLLQDQVYMFSPDDMRFIYLNQRALEQLGWDPEDYTNKSIHDIEELIDVQQIQRKTRRLLRGAETSITFEAVSDASTREINLQLMDPTGSEPRFVAVIRDTTERTAAARAKSEFIATVSHELRTPLTSIKGALGLISMSSDTELPERVQSIVNIAQRNTDRLIFLINDILDLEKLDAGKMDFRMEAMDLSELIHEAIEVNRGYAVQFNVSFVGVGIDQPYLVDGNRDRLMQVMANLMSNAAKFSNPGDEIEVSLNDLGTFVRVSVKDHGSGIPLAAQAHILERFAQADSSDRRKVGGSGLGLSIVKAIVEKHGAQIQFDSEPGKGSVFYFDLQKYAPHQVA
ncbi:ATP-binding protein [Actibacterium sp. D379-3]